jgi:hypothetical protein
MPLFRDDGTAIVVVPVNPDMWNGLHGPGMDPVSEVHRRGLDRLRMQYEMDEEEIAAVDADELYGESCRSAYWSAMRGFDRHRKLPRTLVLHYNRPGTRKSNMKLTREAKDAEDEG